MKLSAISIFFLILCACSPSQKNPPSGDTAASSAAAAPDTGSASRWVSDAEKFAAEYPDVGADNIFVIRTAAQTVEILERGTGVVFLGFPECPWCQYYAVYLQQAAREAGVNRIFYCDIKEDRENNTESYQRIVDIHSGMLQYDDEGREKIFVPQVTIVDSGRIIGCDYETSKNTFGYKTPEEYWTDERVLALKNRLKGFMGQLSEPSCNTCNH